MNLVLKRGQYRSDGIFGKLIDGFGNLIAVTLEHAFEQPDGSFAPAVPPGVYTCLRRLSPEFGYELFCLQNVPGHDYVEIHIGNFNKDSKACILLGQSVTGDANGQMITNSKVTFEKFMDDQTGVNSWELSIVA
jgi:Family of unknown function (DUF5675)